jgi:hypothetical protein
LRNPRTAQNTDVVKSERAKSTSVAHGYNEWKDLGTWRDWSDGWRSGSGDVVSSLNRCVEKAARAQQPES